MSEIRTSQRVDVETEGSVVVWYIGKARAKIRYRTAFRVAQHMRINAKDCMARVGDTKRRWFAAAQLEEGTLKPINMMGGSLLDMLRTIRWMPLPLAPYQPEKKIWVENFGETVRVHLGTSAHVDFYYEDALKISQFLRVQGKIAKRFAGDTWKEMSGLGSLHNAAEK